MSFSPGDALFGDLYRLIRPCVDEQNRHELIKQMLAVLESYDVIDMDFVDDSMEEFPEVGQVLRELRMWMPEVPEEEDEEDFS